MEGAWIFINQNGMMAGPAAVAQRESRIRNMHSSIGQANVNGLESLDMDESLDMFK